MVIENYSECFHVWVDGYGDETHVLDMETSHIKNILRMAKKGQIALMQEQVEMFNDVIKERNNG